MDLVAGAYVGFRHWIVRDGRLLSMNSFLLGGAPGDDPALARVEWPVDRICAAPCRDGSPAPVLACTCGVHAVREPTFCRGGASQHPAYALGAVALWGRVIEHESGFRAQYARPIALLDGSGARSAAVRYGAELVGEDDLVGLVGTTA